MTPQERQEFIKLYGFDPSGASSSTASATPTPSFTPQERKEFVNLYGFEPGSPPPPPSVPKPTPQKSGPSPLQRIGNFINEAPAAVGKWGSGAIQSLLDLSAPAKVGQWGQDVISAPVKGVIQGAQPIKEYLDPAGYGKEDFPKMQKAFGQGVPVTAVNLLGLTHMKPAQIILSYLLGGATAAATGQDFHKGGTSQLERLPTISGVLPFTNSAITAAANKVVPSGAPPLIQELVRRSTAGALGVPEGMLINKLLGRPYSIQDVPTDVLINFLAEGAPKTTSEEAIGPKIEAAEGWKPGMKTQFDRALLHNDAETVKKLLPDVPDYYQKQFADRITSTISPPVASYTGGVADLASQAKQYGSADEFSKAIDTDQGGLVDATNRVTKAGFKSIDDFYNKVAKQPTSFTPLIPGKNIPESYGDEIRAAQKGVPQPDSLVPKPPEDQISEQFVKPKPTEDTWLKQKNPLRKESGKIMAEGPVGNEIVMRARAAQHAEHLAITELNNTTKQLGIDKLSDDEWENIRAWRESGGETPLMSPKAAQVAPEIAKLYDKYGEMTEVGMVPNYWKRGLNEEGMKFYQKPENKAELIDLVAKENNLSRADAVAMVDNGMRRGSFEFKRVLPEIPEQYRMSPKEEFVKWEKEVARRVGIIENFGKNDEIIDDLISKVGANKPNESQIKKEAQEYVDRVAGRGIISKSPLDRLNRYLKSAMIFSKINPITSAKNITQGPLNAWARYGASSIPDVIFKSEGDQMIKEIGLDTLNNKIIDGEDATDLTNAWFKGMGMESTENLNKYVSAKATYGQLTRAFDALVANPGNAEAYKTLKEHSMFVNDADLARAIMAKELPDYELKKGILEGVRQQIFYPLTGERPAWATTSEGSVAYIFKTYLTGQMELLANMPKSRQLAYMMAVAPATGIPFFILEKMIAGEKLPDNPAEWFVGAATAGPGTPVDIARSLLLNPYGFAAGGYGQVADILTAGSPRNILKQLVKHNTPFGSKTYNKLFPSLNKRSPTSGPKGPSIPRPKAPGLR